MKKLSIIYYPTEQKPQGRYAATIGTFDGIHLGHQSVVSQLRAAASARGLRSMVITFERHPRQVLQPEWKPKLLTTLNEKTELFAQMGIDVLVVLRFDLAMSTLSSRQFMEQVLKRDLGVELLLMGYDNHFGNDRSACFNDYVAYGRELDMEVLCGEPADVNGLRASSTLVRNLLEEGRVAQAALCLGRPNSLTGRVVHGQQIGRQLGFPTANILPDDPFHLIPAPGVYAVRIAVLPDDPAPADGLPSPLPDDALLQGMMNIGTRPTFNGQRTTLETHIFDFTGNLYDCRLTIFFIGRLRDEQAFASPQDLAAQMHRDAIEAQVLLSAPNDPSHNP